MFVEKENVCLRVGASEKPILENNLEVDKTDYYIIKTAQNSFFKSVATGDL